MKKSILLITFLFIVLILPSVYADDDVLPNQIQAEKFIQKLIDRYQTLVNKRDYQILEKDEFDFKKRFFSLYLYDEIGSAFNIVCVKCNISKNDGVFFAVEPSQYLTSTMVTLDYNHTLSYYYSGFSLSGINTIAKGNEWTEVFKGIEIVRYYTLAFGVPTQTVIESDFNDIAYLAERIYQLDNQHYEYFRINKTWYPFERKYSDFISNYDFLEDIEDNINDNIMYIFSSNEYDYESFLIDYEPFNRTVHHYYDLPLMQNEFNQFISYISNLTYTIGLWEFSYDFENKFSNEISEIEDNINNNESYIYSDFQEDKLALENNIQNKIDLQEKYLHNWNIYIILFFVNLFFMFALLMALSSEEKKLKKKILPKYFIYIIGLILPFVWTVYIPKDNTDIWQIVFPFTAILFAILFFKTTKKIIIYISIKTNKNKMKKRIKQAIKQLKNKEKPWALTIEDADYFRDNYHKKEIQKIKDKKILKKYLQKEVKKQANAIKELIKKQKEQEIAHLKDADKLFNQNKRKQKKK